MRLCDQPSSSPNGCTHEWKCETVAKNIMRASNTYKWW